MLLFRRHTVRIDVPRARSPWGIFSQQNGLQMPLCAAQDEHLQLLAKRLSNSDCLKLIAQLASRERQDAP